MILEKSQNVHSMVARLLATENIDVVFGKFQTAAFDVKNRILQLPIFKDSNEAGVNEMMIAHEVGHARFTPADGWHQSTKALPGVSRNVINIVEDIRIEKLIMKEYPGLISTFKQGYNGLLKLDFFKLGKRDPNTLGFLDRINVHSKLGRVGVEVSFAADEQPLIDEAMAVESWNDVIEVCRKIGEFMKLKQDEEQQEQQQQQNPGKSQEKSDSSEQGNSDEGENGEGEDEQSASGDEGDEGDEGEDAQSASGSGDEGDEGEETSGKSSDLTNEKNNPYERETAITDKKKKETGEKKPGSLSKAVDRKGQYVEKMTTDTYETGEIKKLIEGNSSDYKYISADHQVFEASKFDWARSKNSFQDPQSLTSYKDLYANTKSAVDALTQRFNMKKNAHTQRRTQQALTGKINPLRLASAKFNDDIFMSYEIKPNEQNHGLIILVDGSSSMGGAGKSAMGSSLYVMTMIAHFCKRVKMPFEIYTFDSMARRSSTQQKYASKSPGAPSKNAVDAMTLYQILSSEDSDVDFRRKMGHLKAIYDGKANGTEYGRFFGGGTPLELAMVALGAHSKNFREKNKLEQVHFMLFTDGEGGGYIQTQQEDSANNGYWTSSERKRTIVDINKKRFIFQKNSRNDAVPVYAAVRKCFDSMVNFYIDRGNVPPDAVKHKQIKTHFGTEVFDYLEHDSYFYLDARVAFKDATSTMNFSKIICTRIGDILAVGRKK